MKSRFGGKSEKERGRTGHAPVSTHTKAEPGKSVSREHVTTSVNKIITEHAKALKWLKDK